MEYIVAGPSIINDIIYSDSSQSKGILGGAVYCLAGIKLWTDNCLYISNTGADFSRYYGEWMDNNNLSLDGINPVLPHTHYNYLHYRPDGLHAEKSIYGPSYEAAVYQAERLQAEQIAAFCDESTRGIYIEAYEDEAIWDELPAIRNMTCAKIMWEIPTSITQNPARHAGLYAVLDKVDIYSLNLPEARMLFSVDSELSAIERIKELRRPCFFRVGQKGSYLIDGRGCHFAPSIDIGAPIDATGCGNSSTAAALYAYCEGCPPRMVAVMANIAAGYNLLQHGPFPKVTPAVRREARALADRICFKSY